MKLNNKQQRVVECLDDCLVVACPGSGKTRVLVQKTKYILDSDSGAKLLVTSFTKDSAAAIRKRILEQVGEEKMKRVITGTFHSIALNQLKHANITGKIIGEGQVRQYVERALKSTNLKDIELDEAVSIIELAKLTPDFEPGNDDHGKLFVAYSEITARNNVMDFADILARAVRGMKNGDVLPKDIQYLLTDESQDLDEMQLSWCVEHIKQKGAIFTVVGDDDQSIYKFRRALGYEGMMRFHRDYGAEIIKLDMNYRCHSEIMDSAAKVIANNTTRVDKALEAVRGPGGRVESYWCKLPSEEASLIVGKILDTCEKSKSPRYLVDVRDDQWAILGRTNFNLEVIASMLKSSFIPYTFSGKTLWEKEPVSLVLSLLSSIVTKHKSGYDLALGYAGVDDDILAELHAEYGDDFHQLFQSGNDYSKYGKGTASVLKAFSEKVPQWEKGVEKERIANVISGSFDWFIAHTNSSSGDKKNSGAREIQRLKICKELMIEMEGELSARLWRVMGGSPSKKDKEDIKEQDPKGVYVGTLHSSKGLEFDNVWLLQMDDGVIPDAKDREGVVWTPALDEEERRLFYVGMTRARNRLFMSCVKAPSMFLMETGVPINKLFSDEDEGEPDDAELK